VFQTKLKLVVNFLVILIKEFIEIESYNEITIQVREIIEIEISNEIIQKTKCCLTLM
jgi:hypothetical protein